MLESKGFAFGATTYRRTGLVAAHGVQDVVAVAEAGARRPGSRVIYVAGVSEGGLVTTLPTTAPRSVCRRPGDLRPDRRFPEADQLLRRFPRDDYFFPDILPGNATNIPTALVKDWPDKFQLAAMEGPEPEPAQRSDT